MASPPSCFVPTSSEEKSFWSQKISLEIHEKTTHHDVSSHEGGILIELIDAIGLHSRREADIARALRARLDVTTFLICKEIV